MYQVPYHTNISKQHGVYIMRTNSCQILSPSTTGFIVSAHRLINTTLLTLAQATL